MLHYLIELAILLALAYLAGACVGCILRKLFGSADVAAPAAGAAVAVPAAVLREPDAPVAPRVVVLEPVAAPVYTPVAPVAAPAVAPAEPVLAAAAMPLAAVGKMERPKGIAAARSGKADDLQRISGIGPKNEKILHGLGFFHFDQIADWTREQVAWVDDHLRFNGRISREEWIKQARLLADGKEAEFARLYGTGGLRNKDGDKLSGSRTRRS
jgi:predicted flap endonuclease-1-like 5' DNA nuclease